MKKTIRLTESALRNIIESVINEVYGGNNDTWYMVRVVYADNRRKDYDRLAEDEARDIINRYMDWSASKRFPLTIRAIKVSNPMHSENPEEWKYENWFSYTA